MIKKANVYIIIILATIGLLMVVEYNKPKELNWFPSYVTRHKIPYGTYVLNELMENLFPETEQVSVPPFQYLKTNFEKQGTYFFLNDNVKFDKAELELLLDWTSEGNTLFIASSSFEKTLLDTLKLSTTGLFAGFGEEQKQIHQLVNPSLKPETRFPFSKDSYSNYFDTIDTLNTKVVGIVENYGDSLAIDKKKFDVIRQNFGKGEIILSSFPKSFTNYFILKDNNRQYTAGLLSYIDADQPIYIDNHHKAGKKFYTSPMYIFLNTKEFKWAYYLILIGTLIYVIFEGKRKQRAIPVVTPLKNQTLAFTRTIADMYFEKSERKPIVAHKIEQFLEYIRSRFFMETIARDEAFYTNLASRSSHTFEDVKKLFTFLENLRNQNEISDADLEKLNASIEKFKHKADGK